MKTLENKILEIYTHTGIYKQFGARDIAIPKIEKYINALNNSKLFIDSVLMAIFEIIQELHTEEKMRGVK